MIGVDSEEERQQSEQSFDGLFLMALLEVKLLREIFVLVVGNVMAEENAG
jgi:hypothetical protein